MKKKDIALVVAVGVVSLVFALLLSKFLIGNGSKSELSAEVVEPITATFTQPDTKYFNNSSIDPTELIRIGNNDNQTPFNQTAQ